MDKEYNIEYQENYNETNEHYNFNNFYPYFYILLGFSCMIKYCLNKNSIKNYYHKITNKDLKKVLIIDQNMECSICLNKFTNENKGYKLKCDHIYHKNCIQEWFLKSKTCPICRININ